MTGVLRFRRPTSALGAACCLALAATAGVLMLEHSSAVAQEKAAQPALEPTAPAGNVDSGKKLFVSAGCALCHNGEGQGGGPGPRLAPNPNMLAFKVFAQRVREPHQCHAAVHRKSVVRPAIGGYLCVLCRRCRSRRTFLLFRCCDRHTRTLRAAGLAPTVFAAQACPSLQSSRGAFLHRIRGRLPSSSQ